VAYTRARLFQRTELCGKAAVLLNAGVIFCESYSGIWTYGSTQIRSPKSRVKLLIIFFSKIYNELTLGVGFKF